MPIVMVSYELKNAARNYDTVVEYLSQFTSCRSPESVWLLDTRMPTEAIRDTLRSLVESSDVISVVRLSRDWAAYNHHCGGWLNAPERNW